MVNQIPPTCNFVFGFLRCDLPEDTIDKDLKSILSKLSTHTRKTVIHVQTNLGPGEYT